MYKYIEISLKKAICLLFGLFLAAGMYAAGTVNLNFFVGRDKILTYAATEGSTYTLSDIISGATIDMSSYQCRDYAFRGWKVGHPVEGTETPTDGDAVIFVFFPDA